MKTKKMMRPIAMAACMLVLGEAHAQTSVLGNNPGTPGTDYVGWDNNTTVPLMVRHNANQPIEWYTDSIQRMQLYQTRTGVLPILTGGTVNVQQNGYLGLSGTPGFFAANGYGPFSRLHLADLDPGNEGQNHYNQPWGYRTWMRNGVTFTGNHDHAYIGQRYYDHDETDLVLQWSDNADKQTQGPDRMRFIFTSGYDGVAEHRAEAGRYARHVRNAPTLQVARAVGVHDPRGPGGRRAGAQGLCGSRAAWTWIVVDFWLHLFIKEKVEKNPLRMFGRTGITSRMEAVYRFMNSPFDSRILDLHSTIMNARPASLHLGTVGPLGRWAVGPLGR